MTTIVKPQHFDALAEANRVRLARAEIRRRVREGELPVAKVLIEHHRGDCRNMPVGELLAAQMNWGGSKVRKFLTRFGISESKRLAALTDRQRLVMVRALVERGRGVAA